MLLLVLFATIYLRIIVINTHKRNINMTSKFIDLLHCMIFGRMKPSANRRNRT